MKSFPLRENSRTSLPLLCSSWILKTLRSVSDHHVFVVCEDIDLRRQQPNLSSLVLEV